MKRLLKRVLSIWQASVLPVRARCQLLLVAFMRRLLPLRQYGIDLKKGKAFLSGDSVIFDYAAFCEIFVNECYQTRNHGGATVIDLGGHKGYYGAYALLQGAARVLSFEPERSNYKWISEAAKSFASKGSQWLVEKAAVGSHEGTVDLHVTDRSWSHSIFQREDRETVDVEQVSMRSLTSILDQAQELSPEGFIVVKINVEGAECDIVLGTPVHFWKRVQEVFVEFEPWAPCRWDELLEHFQQAGFRLSKGGVGKAFRLVRETQSITRTSQLGNGLP